MQTPTETPKTDNWTRLVILLLWGAPFLLGRTVQIVGLMTCALLFFDPRVLSTRLYVALTKRDTLSGFAWPLLISAIYGIAQLIYGLLAGHQLITTLEILSFNVYPFSVFLGIWVGTRNPGLIRQYIRYISWFAVIYAPLYFIFLNKVHLFVMGDTPVFTAPGTGSVALLGLLVLESNLATFVLPIIVLSFLTIAAQERADWLGLGAGLLIWGTATRKLGRLFGAFGLIAALLLIGFITDFSLPPIPGRGGEISARETVARAVAAVSAQAAEDIGSSRSNANFYNGTVYWRQKWWAGIREAVSENYATLIFGLGYGYPLADLAGPDMKGSETRSPHSIFYFTLAYSGVIGVLLFFWLQVGVFRLLWQTFKATGQVFGLAYYACMFLQAFFGNFLETPGMAIPTYLIVGLSLGPLFRQLDRANTLDEWAPRSSRMVPQSDLSPSVSK